MTAWWAPRSIWVAIRSTLSSLPEALQRPHHPVLRLLHRLSDGQGETPAEKAQVEQYVQDFMEATNWYRTRWASLPALLYTQYGLVKRFIMKSISKVRAATSTPRDYEYTDWESVDDFGDTFLAAIAGVRSHRQLICLIRLVRLCPGDRHGLGGRQVGAAFTPCARRSKTAAFPPSSIRCRSRRAL